MSVLIVTHKSGYKIWNDEFSKSISNEDELRSLIEKAHKDPLNRYRKMYIKDNIALVQFEEPTNKTYAPQADIIYILDTSPWYELYQYFHEKSFKAYHADVYSTKVLDSIFDCFRDQLITK